MTAKRYEAMMDYIAMMALAFLIGLLIGQSTTNCHPAYQPQPQNLNHTGE